VTAAVVGQADDNPNAAAAVVGRANDTLGAAGAGAAGAAGAVLDGVEYIPTSIFEDGVDTRGEPVVNKDKPMGKRE
jgi:hypothetical protein